MTSHSITLRRFVTDRFPGRDVAVASEPEPLLLEHNLVCLADDPERARAVLVDWERIVDADGAVGYLALGDRAGGPEASAEVDRQIGRRTLRRIILGAVPGAALFAVVVAAVVWIVQGWSGTVIGAFLGGLAFGMVPGAFITYVRGTGWSSAYEDSHAPVDSLAVAIASIHSDDVGAIERAAEVAHDHPDVRIVRVDRRGVERH